MLLEGADRGLRGTEGVFRSCGRPGAPHLRVVRGPSWVVRLRSIQGAAKRRSVELSGRASSCRTMMATESLTGSESGGEALLMNAVVGCLAAAALLAAPGCQREVDSYGDDLDQVARERRGSINLIRQGRFEGVISLWPLRQTIDFVNRREGDSWSDATMDLSELGEDFLPLCLTTSGDWTVLVGGALRESGEGLLVEIDWRAHGVADEGELPAPRIGDHVTELYRGADLGLVIAAVVLPGEGRNVAVLDGRGGRICAIDRDEKALYVLATPQSDFRSERRQVPQMLGLALSIERHKRKDARIQIDHFERVTAG